MKNFYTIDFSKNIILNKQKFNLTNLNEIIDTECAKSSKTLLQKNKNSLNYIILLEKRKATRKKFSSKKCAVEKIYKD